MLPLGCEAAPILRMRCIRQTTLAGFTTAVQPSGSKLPRHKSASLQSSYVDGTKLSSIRFTASSPSMTDC
ncbi:MAG: hypothetical protein C0411_01330 [Pseudomonas sp.]|nr:hypothetical protein [Pseudomonas sp.]